MKHAFLTLLLLFICLEAPAVDFTSTKGGSHCESAVNGIKTCTVNWAHDVDHGSHNFSITDTDFGTTYYFKNKQFLEGKHKLPAKFFTVRCLLLITGTSSCSIFPEFPKLRNV